MMRILSSLLLALVLALTSQSMAVARGAAPAAGKVVLCSGGGFVAVYLDAEGEPTSAPHICPDAALNFTADHSATGAQAPWHLVTGSAPAAMQATQPPLAPRRAAHPRAPPLTV